MTLTTVHDLTTEVLRAACDLKHPDVAMEQALRREGFTAQVAARVMESRAPTELDFVPCVDGAYDHDDVTNDPQKAIFAAEQLKEAHPDDVVTILVTRKGRST